MLKTELEKWKEDTEKVCLEAHNLIDGKSYGDMTLANMKDIWKLMRGVLGLEIPIDDD
tara:strand:+ start:2192 stop:2365 length:174 start_codon:yes stop_codon:yes gene_type:complete